MGDEMGVNRGLRLPIDLDAKILIYARDHNLVEKVSVHDLNGKRKTIEIPNWSEAVRSILEEFFKVHDACTTK